MRPCWDDFPKHCPYPEGIHVGWRALLGKPVTFAFGHGLSYTTFAYAWAAPPRRGGGGGAVAELSVALTNVGNATGAEVVQLYVAFPASAGEPERVLRGAQKTAPLSPGGTATLTFALRPQDLSVWSSTAGNWVRVLGRFTALVGGSSRATPLRHDFHVVS